MRIAWIVPGFQSDAADWCIPALTALAHRVAAQHHLKVFALQYPGREDCYRVGAVEVQSFRAGPPSNVSKLARPGPIARAIGAIQREDFDVVHAFWAAESALVGVWATSLNKKPLPLIVACMGGETVYLSQIGYGTAHKIFDRTCLRLAVARAHTVTAGSHIQAALLKAKFGDKVSPVVMPLGVDTIRFQPPATTQPLPNQPLILAVGSLLPVKGHAHLIEAVAKLPTLRLKIVGEGRERPRLQKLIARWDLQDRIELVGAVSAEAMPSQYASADILALPSYYESQCMALLEGMACGLPVVSATVGIAPQLLGDGGAGEIAPDNTPASLANALTRLLKRGDEWSQIKRAAQTKAASFSLQVCATRLTQLYADVTAINEKR